MDNRICSDHSDFSCFKLLLKQYADSAHKGQQGTKAAIFASEVSLAASRVDVGHHAAGLRGDLDRWTLFATDVQYTVCLLHGGFRILVVRFRLAGL